MRDQGAQARWRQLAVASILILAVAALAIGGFRHWQKAVQAQHYQQIIGQLTEHAGLFGLAAAPSVVFDRARMFVNDHSTHNIDAAFFALWRAPERVATAVLAHAQGHLTEKPHLECSTRTHVLSGILRTLGFATRQVVLYDHTRQLASHTLLEVLNPQTQRWEIEDPDYDIYWRHKASGKRASITAVVAAPEQHEPCGRAQCGWDQPSSEGQTPEFLRPYLHLASIIDKERPRRVSFYHAEFDPAQQFTYAERTGTFCELLRKNCRDGFVPATTLTTE